METHETKQKGRPAGAKPVDRGTFTIRHLDRKVWVELAVWAKRNGKTLSEALNELIPLALAAKGHKED